MSLDHFNNRIARINNKTSYGAADLAQGEGSAVLMFSSPLPQKQTTRRNIKPILMGIVLGLIVGVTLAGSVNPDSLWGPGTAYVDYVKMPSVLGLVMAPLMVVIAVIMQNRMPNFFYTTVGYFPAVLGAAMFSSDLTGLVQNIPLPI